MQFCECQAAGKNIMQCANILDAVCKGYEKDGKTFNLSGCVDEYYYEYWQTYCDFATCAIAGGSYASCECEWYGIFCDKLESHPFWAASEGRLEACKKKGDCCFDNNGQVDVSQCFLDDADAAEEKEGEEGAGSDKTTLAPPANAPNSARRKEYGGTMAAAAFVGWLLSFFS